MPFDLNLAGIAHNIVAALIVAGLLACVVKIAIYRYQNR